MPFCEVGKNNEVKIFYRTYGSGPTKVLLIIGLASTHESWSPQIRGLTGGVFPNGDDEEIPATDRNSDDDGTRATCSNENGGGIQVCAFDNRGIGRSSVPIKRSKYTTKNMAQDAIALLDHLNWKKAHVFGHSMGAMIACKLAAMAPERVLSLALLNVTGGGFECFPKFDRRTFSILVRLLRAKTPEQRASVDLDTHYSEEYLEEHVGFDTRRSLLYKEYVKGISATGMQSNYGFEGQLYACWTHSITSSEMKVLRSAGFLAAVIHGRHDIIAQISNARKLAKKLHPVARMVELHGGHLVSHERSEEVNKALNVLIKASTRKMNPQEWSMPNAAIGWKARKTSSRREDDSFINSCKRTVHRWVSDLFRVFRWAFRCLRRVKVGDEVGVGVGVGVGVRVVPSITLS